jgi:hypothetical protein
MNFVGLGAVSACGFRAVQLPESRFVSVDKPMLGAGRKTKTELLGDPNAVAERAKIEKENRWLHKFRAASLLGHCGQESIYARRQ